jgi:hypothetical protein
MSKTSDNKEFENIKISTTTVILYTNLFVDRFRLFERLPIQKVVIPPEIKIKKDMKLWILGQQYPDGSIITLQEDLYKIRGFQIKKKKKGHVENMSSIIYPEWSAVENYKYKDIVFFDKGVWTALEENTGKEPQEGSSWLLISIVNSDSTAFRNSLTIVMIIAGNLINFKVPTRGKIQMTGVKNVEHIELCLYHFWKLVKSLALDYPDVYELDIPLRGDVSGVDTFYVVSRIVMTNKNFTLDFNINKENLDHYINTKTPFNSLLETSAGYAVVNIKIPFSLGDNTLINTFTFYKDTDAYTKGDILYNDLFKLLSHKDQLAEKRKKRHNTFLVFSSGATILTGMNIEYMKNDYFRFKNMILESNSYILEDEWI